jgi:tRNA pseudouridine38-40 synthase
MPRYRLDIAYDGSSYQGWQKQSQAVTIQGEIEQALRRILNDGRISITGSGRTDTGVHARGQVAHADLQWDGPADQLCHKLNRLLPDDIRITAVVVADPDFHARFDASSRTYRYHLSLAFDPMRPYEWVVGKVDTEAMREVGRGYVGTHDFKRLSATTPALASTICTVRSCDIVNREDGRMEVVVVADRFLRNMVRRMVGEMVKAGRGGRPTPVVAPAKALVLERVAYEKKDEPRLTE